jgi:hypothetical protein
MRSNVASHTDNLKRLLRFTDTVKNFNSREMP